METEKESGIDYGAILSDLEGKKAAIEAAIAGLKAMMGVMGTSEGMSFVKSDAMVVNPSIHGGEIPAGAFLGKSIPEAVKAYLSLVKKKATTREIAEALLKGGMETSGKGSFETIVGSALYRVRGQGEIIRVKGAWGLSEWWPAGLRAAGRQEKRKTRKAKKTVRKEPKPLILDDKILSAASSANGAQKLSDRIVQTLREKPNKEFTKAQLSASLGVAVKTLAPVLARLTKKSSLSMPSPGTYCAARN